MNASSPFRSSILEKDKMFFSNVISQALKGDELVVLINDLLFCSILVRNNEELSTSPVCVLNSIKNFISEDKENPSKHLLAFAIDYLFSFKFRKNDKKDLTSALNNNDRTIAFIGELEDACQKGEWGIAESLLVKTFIASDQSRGVFDVLVEIALQDAHRHGLFVYHILRAYQFQERKSDTWSFTKSLFDRLKNTRISPPHQWQDVKEDYIFNNAIINGHVPLYCALQRLWNGKYVRIKGYKREISFWLKKTINRKQKNLSFKQFSERIMLDKKSFLSSAESITKKKRNKDEIAILLVELEALRFLYKILDQETFDSLINKYRVFDV